MDSFTRAYIECALWSSNDESDERGGEPLDKNFSSEDIHADTLAKMTADCTDFLASLPSELVDLVNTDPERGGHDFWLTRNRHGAGFWDGDWPEPAGAELTKAAHTYGCFNLLVGDDGMVHGY